MSVKQLRKELEIVRRAIQPAVTEKGEEIQALLRQAESLAPFDSPLWRDAAKAVVKDYVEGLIK